MQRVIPFSTEDPNAPPELGPREFAQIRKLMEARTGVHLTEAKGALVMARLGRRLRELRLRSYRDYMAHLDAHPAEEIAELVDRLLTNETRLFREGWQFDFLEQTIVPLWRKEAGASLDRSLRIWSAACSTGEEPASLAAVMDARFPVSEGYRVTILATDLSSRALAAARTLTFPIARGQDIPPSYARYFEDVRPDRMRLRASSSRLIRFEPMNLLAPSVPAASFDLILCRNVLIYFTRETKRQVIDHMWRALKPGGFLFVGHAESLVGVIEGQRPVKPAIYLKPLSVRS
ncbi:MAG: protein-glutamate O-methyltransferase CheR [Vicinamibacteria bacterium]|nr:protein-glutamate O-methyltransferase CheR [Vicinamibacteria bacterium]